MYHNTFQKYIDDSMICNYSTCTYIVPADIFIQPAAQTPNFKKDTAKTPNITQCGKLSELHCL